MLASAGDDGNILLWVPAENPKIARAFGDDGLEDKETWRVKRICGSMAEVYDLAWSPDGSRFITGSIDNIARIWDANTGNACHLANGAAFTDNLQVPASAKLLSIITSFKVLPGIR